MWACVIPRVGLTDVLSTCRGFVIHLAIPEVNGLISVASHKYGPLLVGCLSCLMPRCGVLTASAVSSYPG